MNNIEKAILDIIEKRYKRKYTGEIKVTKLGDSWKGYKLVMDLGNPDKRVIQISADLEADDFVKYVEQELISRQLQRVQFFKGYIKDDERETC